MSIGRVLQVAALALFAAGCATIIGGTSQTITVNSNVEGAEVWLNQTLLGTTPLTASVKRGQEGVLRVTAEGYQPHQIALNKKVSTLFWVNIFSGGVFGSSTDYSTGAMYEYEPATFMASLQRRGLGMEELEHWQLLEGLRSFVLQNNEAILSDLAEGKGEYIDVLVHVLAVQPDEQAQALDRWRAHYSASATAAEFAARIVAEFEQTG